MDVGGLFVGVKREVRCSMSDEVVLLRTTHEELGLLLAIDSLLVAECCLPPELVLLCEVCGALEEGSE